MTVDQLRAQFTNQRPQLSRQRSQTPGSARREVEVDEVNSYAGVAVSRDKRTGRHRDVDFHTKPDQLPYLPLGPIATDGCFDQVEDPHGAPCCAIHRSVAARTLI